MGVLTSNISNLGVLLFLIFKKRNAFQEKTDIFPPAMAISPGSDRNLPY
jgi:hypothetical protein